MLCLIKASITSVETFAVFTNVSDVVVFTVDTIDISAAFTTNVDFVAASTDGNTAVYWCYQCNYLFLIILIPMFLFALHIFGVYFYAMTVPELPLITLLPLLKITVNFVIYLYFEIFYYSDIYSLWYYITTDAFISQFELILVLQFTALCSDFSAVTSSDIMMLLLVYADVAAVFA